MVNRKDIEAANTLVELANGVRRRTVQPSENVLADSSDASEKGRIKLRIRLRESCSSGLNQKKRRNDDEFSWTQVDELQKDSTCLSVTERFTDKSMSVNTKILPKKQEAGTSSSGGINRDRFKKNSIETPERVIEPAKMQRCNNRGFSFSIIHLLTAVCYAVINPQQQLHSLTIHRILELVRLTPGDPSILETRESLLHMIRQCLKMLSSEAGPVGAVGWKPLLSYDKTRRCWSWIGPVPVDLLHDDAFMKKITSKHLGISQTTLEKLVNCFADWLKQTQDTLREIARLPPPPAVLMHRINRKDRFKYKSRRKSVCTIQSSSEEVRNYFRKEEALRYALPDWAFPYTARDGRRSTVAPLRNSSGNLLVGREHYMLCKNRPLNVTILCLVRDAAARLPGRVGTKADICLLVRDSEFIAEEISEHQLTEVVGAALDRLRSESDPCVKYEKPKHLWTYLHAEREDEDF